MTDERAWDGIERCDGEGGRTASAGRCTRVKRKVSLVLAEATGSLKQEVLFCDTSSWHADKMKVRWFISLLQKINESFW
jgi:hypothetical protein